jgi:hypothetical protein
LAKAGTVRSVRGDRGTLQIIGCAIGGVFALFSIVFLMPHMETIASLVDLVACR